MAGMTPKRIQLRRTKGWRKPEGCIFVARPSKWGNPWRVYHDDAKWWLVEGPLETHKGFPSEWAAAEFAVRRYRAHIGPVGAAGLAQVAVDVSSLRGHDLACWCPLEDARGRRVPCHADVLLELANR